MKNKFLMVLVGFSVCNGIANIAFAADAEMCLSVDEQKQYGVILQHYADAVMKKPNCTRYWGAAGCISPNEEAGKRYFEDRLRKCAEE